MKRIFAAIVALTLVVTGACADSDDSDTASGTDEPTELDPDATLRYAWTVQPGQLDPHLSTSNLVDYPYLSPVYDRLTYLANGQELQPMLAESWEFAADNSSVTFELRDDVTFHDGTPFTAEAVKLSIERALTLEGSNAAGYFEAIASVEVVDDDTVTFHVSRPAAELPYLLANTYASIISPTALEEGVDLATTTAGSGPYMISEVRSGDRIVYERNPDYWDPEAQKVARLEIVGIPEDNARLNALRSGQIDAMMVKLGQYGEVSQLGEGFDFHAYPPSGLYSVWVNTDREVVSDVRVREALAYALDREAISEAVMFGQCAPTSQVIQEGFDGYVEDLEGHFTHDPERARQHLADAGYADGLDLSMLVYSGVSPQQEIAQAVQAQLAEVGIDAELLVQPTAEGLAAWAGGEIDVFVHNHSIGATPALTLSNNFLVANRFPGTPADGFEDLIVSTFDATLSDEERTDLLEQANTLAVDEVIDVPICADPKVVAFKDTVVGMDQMSHAQTGVFDVRYLGVRAG